MTKHLENGGPGLGGGGELPSLEDTGGSAGAMYDAYPKSKMTFPVTPKKENSKAIPKPVMYKSGQ